MDRNIRANALAANSGTSRRKFLASVGATGAALAVGTGQVAAQDSPYGGWFSNVSNYDGTVDYTGEDRVTVTVGSQANNGAFGFDPAAIKVDPGTTVVWEWNGKGGSHNVEAEDGSFKSEMTGEQGFTFEQTFQEEGIYKYFCMPHRAMGMKGAVAVGDVVEATAPASGSSGSESSGSGSSDGNSTGNSDSSGGSDGDGSGDSSNVGASGGGAAIGLLGIGAAFVLALLSPFAFAGFLQSRDSEDLD